MTVQKNATSNNNILTGNRIESIDLLRGFVMILMALDHLRPYFHFESMIFDPANLERTTPGFFATRFITHLCAPTFILLAGTSIYFVRQRKSVKETSIFLLTRGAWLILLQMTLIRFGWNFDPLFHYNSSTIISTIGFCMIGLAALIHLPFRVILGFGLVLVAGHNLLDNIHPSAGSSWEVLWSFLHGKKLYVLGGDYKFNFLYPFIPWVGVMALGYCLGRWYEADFTLAKRKSLLIGLGTSILALSLFLRWANGYGDPVPWSLQNEQSMTIVSFFNITKYPPSLVFLCCTLGIALIILGLLEGKNLKPYTPVVVFGKVALFYYVLHIYVIHLLAFVTVVLSGYPWQTMIFIGSHESTSALLKGKFGFSLGVVYLIWVFVILMLYPICKYWQSFKTRNKSKWWVSYV